jgi:hypothetical protein
LLQTIDVAGESNNTSPNPKKGTVCILALKKYRVNEKECISVPVNMDSLMFFQKNGVIKKSYVRKETGIQRTTRNKTL